MVQEVFGLDRYDLIGLDMEERKVGPFFTQVCGVCVCVEG